MIITIQQIFTYQQCTGIVLEYEILFVYLDTSDWILALISRDYVETASLGFHKVI